MINVTVVYWWDWMSFFEGTFIGAVLMAIIVALAASAAGRAFSRRRGGR